ncbi:hypothetical protein FEM48_Zijuj04G0110400 [Ziziphus jujuba var. spinosa]|uniref:O-methyltransferase C-terminal domain-containing protein n=1 Tax=Ziziphus jujuba var. spinosa TaxID=714518 RepID=A0A978VJH9_ZIZJJ|nr:hypothetical protein FEM48_Zijuj04G0110400 [Ziziphus jujuba var. spinosa]
MIAVCLWFHEQWILHDWSDEESVKILKKCKEAITDKGKNGKWILHDWSDEESVKILKKCKEAITDKGKNGKVIIIDMMMENKKGDEESIETQLFFDTMMMILVTGKERTEKEWAKLFSDAGFNNYSITPILGLRSLIEVYP